MSSRFSQIRGGVADSHYPTAHPRKHPRHPYRLELLSSAVCRIGCSHAVLMKRLLTITLLAFLISACSERTNPENYSFEITDKILSSEFESKGNSGDNVCRRTAIIAWDLNIRPKDFTGYIYFNGTEILGKYRRERESFDDISNADNEWSLVPRQFLFRVINGKMLPTKIKAYVSYSNDEEYSTAVCALNSSKQIKIEVDPSTIIMVPGVNPIETSGE